MEFINKFSNNYKRTLKAAAALATELQHRYIEPSHLLYGLTIQRGSVGAEIFGALDITPEQLRDLVSAGNLETRSDVALEPELSAVAREIIEKSAHIAFINQHQYVGTEHLLAALIEINHVQTRDIFEALSISTGTLTQQTIATLKSTSKLPDLTQAFKLPRPTDRHGRDSSESVLETYGIELTSRTVQTKIDPVVGREKEISRLTEILSRRTKNNPLLLGEPGVGKTAIVEGLAKRIAANDVPEALRGKKIYALDLTATVAGTMYRGEFENRIKQIIDEATERPEVILFIDEIHNIVGAGSASGSMDAANILKPALARGAIRCIGATTYADYRKSIESDPALERRFQTIAVSEPTATETLKILEGIRPHYEAYHDVTITDAALATAIDLSQKYVPEKFLPDKAIDVIDEASARHKVNRKLTKAEEQLRQLNLELLSATDAKRQAIDHEDFVSAVEFKRIASELETRIAKLSKRPAVTTVKHEVTADDIAQVVATMTGIPVTRLVNSERRRLLKIEAQLRRTIVGQDDAMHQISRSIIRAKAGLGETHRPLASFLFVGPSGVGKTYTAKTLAKLLFNDERAFIRIDMSEYGERFTVSKLIGAPAGYVGYKESGQLTEKVKHRPYSLVLFDEIDKADPDVFDLLLQVLDDGYLTDASGVKINFQNTVVIMTSNIGSHLLVPRPALGFERETPLINDQIEHKIEGELRQHFKPEFLNRIDKIIYFNQLSPREIKRIAVHELEALARRLGRQNVALIWSPAVVTHLVQLGSEDHQGARGIKKLVQEHVETPLAEKLLAGTPPATMRLGVKNGIIVPIADTARVKVSASI